MTANSLRQSFPFVTLFVLNYNGKERLTSCLDSLLTTTYPRFKIVIVDNGSTDDSIELIRKSYPQIDIIQHDKNHGYACGLNLAAEHAESEYFAFLNNDITVNPRWLENLVIHASAEKVAAVNPKILFLSNNRIINAAGGNCDIYGLGWNRGNGEFDHGQYDSVQEVFYVNGAALLTKRDIWKDVGPFDERYFLYGEDLDWCWRARLKRYRVLYVPSARIFHHWQGSAGSMIECLEKHWFASFLKNYSLRTILALIPRYFALKFMKAVWLMKNGRRTSEKFGVFTSFIWNLVNLRSTWTKRVSVQSSRKISDKEIQKHMYKESFEILAWIGEIRHPEIQRLRERNQELHF